MKKTVLTVLISLIFGGAGGFVVGIFICPFLFPPPPAMEKVEIRSEKMVVASGMFIHANPSDPVHYGEGSASVFRDQTGTSLIHLEGDFKVGPGPKYHVYLVDHDSVRTAVDVKNGKWVDLGQLRAFEGSQNYAVPADINLADYKSIVIWC